MVAFILWYLISTILGLLALPLARQVLRWLPDQGYTFARSIGLLVVSYLVWLGASTHLLRNDLGGILLAGLLLAGLSAWIFQGQHRDGFSWRTFFKEKRQLIVTTEILFLVAFLAWTLLRAYAADKIMNAGGEKFMEIAFLNAILNSRQFPPLDPWLSGFAISYYYFGYVMMAVLTRLSGVASGVGFDLYDALLFALTALGTFGVVYNLIQGSRSSQDQQDESKPAAAIPYGLLGVFFVVLMSNLEGVLETLHSRGLLSQGFLAWIDIPDLARAPSSGRWFPGALNNWWWWRGSRVIQDYDLAGNPLGVSPITEFPFFSFLLGDNHPHVLALPFALLAIGLAYNLLRRQFAQQALLEQPGEEKPQAALKAWWNPIAFSLDGDWLLFLAYALFLGSLAFLNTWDFPIYLGLTLLAYAGGSYLHKPVIDLELSKRTVSLAVGLLGGGVLLYLFFYLGFRSQASGLLPYVFPPTRLPQYLVMFGAFILILGIFLPVYLFQGQLGKDRRHAMKALQRGWLIVAGAALAILLLIVSASAIGSWIANSTINQLAQNPEVQSVLGGRNIPGVIGEMLTNRLRDPWLFLVLATLLGLSVASALWELPSRWNLSGSQRAPSELFVFLLIFTGLALTWIVEFMYLRDSFNVRMNTVFKFYFQGWVMLACASAYGVWWLLGGGASLTKGWRYVLQGMLGIFTLAGLVYPMFAIYSRVNAFQSIPNLDGASGIALNHPEDWAAITWLNGQPWENTPPVILEAPGGSYTYEGRISAFTGFPAVLGWAVHESQWRGNYNEQGKREPDIATIYTTSDARLMLDLLRAWQVDYVILGQVERNYIQKVCGDETRRCNLQSALRKFDLVLSPVFQQEQLTIYEVPGRESPR